MITTQEIKHLATLARIKLTESDEQSLVKEFDSILGYIDQLKQVNVSLEAGQRVGAVKNVVRDDMVDTQGADREALLAEVPKREGDFVVVKQVFEE